jgi:hypothetical protein
MIGNQESWQEWYTQQQAGKYEVVTASLDNMDEWKFITVEEDGQIYTMFGREDGEVYRIEGVHLTTETRSHFQALMRRLPIGNDIGYVAIGVDRNSDRYLLQAKKEIGYTSDINYTIIAPALQTSSSNLRQVHGGPKPPRAEWVDKATMFPIRQDGGMFRYKVNNIGFIELDLDSLELLPTERIFTTKEISEVMEAKLCNDHVMQAMGVYKLIKCL